MKANHLTTKLTILIAITLLTGGLYLFLGIDWDILEYQLQSRVRKLILMILVGAAIGTSVIIFQAITVNRLLTPSMMGLDAVYMFIKVLLIFVFGVQSLVVTNLYLNFTLTLVAMILFALLLFQVIFKYGNFSVYFILLIGVILGTFFRSITGFLELVINPEEFLAVQSSMFANFNASNEKLVAVCGVVLLVLIIITIRVLPYLDVLLLGKAQAMNLGVNYTRVTRLLMIMVALLTAIATALVGPITFLGLLTINVAHEIMKTYEYKFLLPATIMLSWISLFSAEWIVEHLFEATTEVSILINLVGGTYFIYLLISRRNVQ